MKRVPILCFLLSSMIGYTADLVDYQEYDSCAVVTLVDEFTDERWHRLACQANDTQELSLSITCTEEAEYIQLHQEIRFSVNAIQVMVKWRFDKNQVHAQTWKWNQDGRYVFNLDRDVSAHFMEGIQTSDRLVFEIGKRERQKIVFTDNARLSVAGFQRRCSESGYPSDGA